MRYLRGKGHATILECVASNALKSTFRRKRALSADRRSLTSEYNFDVPKSGKNFRQKMMPGRKFFHQLLVGTVGDWLSILAQWTEMTGMIKNKLE